MVELGMRIINTDSRCMGIKNRKKMCQVLQNLNVLVNCTRVLKLWSFNYFEEYI